MSEQQASVEYDWQKLWNDDDTGFHKPFVLEDLLKYENILLNENCRVFVPLCGKSVDLVYLADKGHDVYGCELIKSPILAFFEEQKLKFSTISIIPNKLIAYKATSKKITIYCGDFFHLKSSEIGKFNAIWDRASFIAINPVRREEYAKVMQDLMASSCKYLLNSYIITGENYQGPPHSVPIENIEKCFGAFCEIRQLDSRSDTFPLPNLESVQIINSLFTAKF